VGADAKARWARAGPSDPGRAAAAPSRASAVFLKGKPPPSRPSRGCGGNRPSGCLASPAACWARRTRREPRARARVVSGWLAGRVQASRAAGGCESRRRRCRIVRPWERMGRGSGIRSQRT
jgi:hypothetical protein